MATNHVNAKTDFIFLKYLYEHDLCTDADKELLKSAFKRNNTESLTASMIMEHCIEKASKGTLKHESMFRKDFHDNSDAKMCTTYRGVDSYSGNEINWTTISCGNKIGTIRAMIYEVVSKKFYFFVIPFNEYKKSIKIDFKLDGTPKRHGKIWKYEVENFHEMSKLIENVNYTATRKT